jgi:hypothetical protein
VRDKEDDVDIVSENGVLSVSEMDTVSEPNILRVGDNENEMDTVT